MRNRYVEKRVSPLERDAEKLAIVSITAMANGERPLGAGEDIAAQPTVVALAAALRPVLGLAPAPAPPIDAATIAFAQRRHRVAPLLHVATRHEEHASVDSPARRGLAQLYENNARRVLTQRAALDAVVGLLARHGVATIAIKGPQLGEQLYGDSAARHSKDVDILIAPGDAAAAIGALIDGGYTHLFDGPVARKSWPAWRMRILKDTSFREPETGRTIELHQRLFPIEPPGLTALLVGAARGRAVADIADDPYVLYLLLHGAMGYWPRLKWLADACVLVRRVDGARVANLQALARSYRCEPAIVASLNLVEETFPGSLADEWCQWAHAISTQPAARALLGAYRRSLCGNHAADPLQPPRKASFPTAAWHVFAGAIARPEILARRAAMASLTQLERLVR